MKLGIAGAGLTGRVFAWRALLAGHQVAMFEAGSFSSSSAAAHTAAGMVAPLSELVDADPQTYAIGLESIELWRAWTDELAAVGESVEFSAAGSIAVAHAQDRAELRQFARDLETKLQPLGAAADFRWLERAELERLEPDLAVSFDHGLMLTREARIDNRRLLAALLNEIRRLGAELHAGAAVNLAPNRVITSDTEYEFDCVIDCRGFGAKQDWPGLRGVRGELIRVACADIALSRPVRLMHPRYQLYVVPQPGQRFVVGASEIESEDRSQISLHTMLELGSALYSLNPAFAEARILESAVNLRPAFMNNAPRLKVESGLIRINGLYRHGYLLAPAMVVRMLEQLQSMHGTGAMAHGAVVNG